MLERVKEIIDLAIAEAKQELYETYGVTEKTIDIQHNMWYNNSAEQRAASKLRCLWVYAQEYYIHLHT